MRMNVQVGTVWYQRLAPVWYHRVPMSRWKKMATTRSKRRRGSGEEVEARGRILDAAFAEFEQNGLRGDDHARDRHTCAGIKCELYSLVGNKEKMLAARGRPQRKPNPPKSAGDQLEQDLSSFHHRPA